MQAKVDLVREMNRRQGYLDGEDQKTLISFVLYGDPLATYDGFRARGKAVHRTKDHMKVKVVPDQPEKGGAVKLSNEALEQVKLIVGRLAARRGYGRYAPDAPAIHHQRQDRLERQRQDRHEREWPRGGDGKEAGNGLPPDPPPLHARHPG